MKRLLIIPLFLIFLVGCSVPSINTETYPTATPTETPSPTIAAPIKTQSPETNITTLHIWVPPQFDPNNDTPAAEVFNTRLKEFVLRRPNTKIEVRVKALEGPGGLLDSLTTANAAAPLSVPDLVALPRDIMETAAIKGLLHPYDGLTSSMDEPDWYGYARQLALLQNSTFGIPFAGDALVMVYRPAAVETQPSTWAEALEIQKPLVFAAADPQALFTLALYQSLGGALLDDEERPMLEPSQLVPVFTYYQNASNAGLMPFWITQYETDDQSWASFEQEQTDMVITWASRYLQSPPADASIAQIPTEDGSPITTAAGWVWALSSPDSNRHELSTQLAEFLTTSDFLAKWTSAAGYPPPRPSSLKNWNNPPERILMEKILPSAKLIPPQDILNTIGPIVRDATISILKDKADPITAAQNASDELIKP